MRLSVHNSFDSKVSDSQRLGGILGPETVRETGVRGQQQGTEIGLMMFHGKLKGQGGTEARDRETDSQSEYGQPVRLMSDRPGL